MATATATIMPMIEPGGERVLMRLMAWLSPAFPVGAFSYSHGLERAIHDGLVADAATLEAWIEALLRHGSQWNDAVLLGQAWRRAGAGGDLDEIAELAVAMAGSAERHMEARLQGEAFARSAAAWPEGMPAGLPDQSPYCVAFGACAGHHGLPLAEALTAYLQAFAGNQVQAAIRLSLIGQTDAVATLARLEGAIAETARAAARASLDDLGSCTIMAEIAAIRHETQHTRLFRS